VHKYILIKKIKIYSWSLCPVTLYPYISIGEWAAQRYIANRVLQTPGVGRFTVKFLQSIQYMNIFTELSS